MTAAWLALLVWVLLVGAFTTGVMVGMAVGGKPDAPQVELQPPSPNLNWAYAAAGHTAGTPIIRTNLVTGDQLELPEPRSPLRLVKDEPA